MKLRQARKIMKETLDGIGMVIYRKRTHERAIRRLAKAYGIPSPLSRFYVRRPMIFGGYTYPDL